MVSLGVRSEEGQHTSYVVSPFLSFVQACLLGKPLRCLGPWGWEWGAGGGSSWRPSQPTALLCSVALGEFQ